MNRENFCFFLRAGGGIEFVQGSSFVFIMVGLCVDLFYYCGGYVEVGLGKQLLLPRIEDYA